MSANAARFSIVDAFAAGWRTFVANLVPMLVYAAIVVIVNVVLDLLTDDTTGFVASTLMSFIAFLITQLLAIGWIRIALDAVDGQPISVDRIKESFGIIVPFAIAAVLFSVGVSIGLILLIVPGIVVAVTFGLYGPILVDGVRTDALEALRHSAEITRGERLHLFGFGVALVLLNMVGFLLLVVGVIVTSAVSVLAAAHVYRQLQATRGGGMMPGESRTEP